MTKTIKRPDLNLNALDREARLLRSQLSDMKCLFDTNDDKEHKEATQLKLKQLEELITAINEYKEVLSKSDQTVKD